MSWTFTTSGAAVLKAGKTISGALVLQLTADTYSVDTIKSALQKWSDNAEGAIIAETRRDWLANYSDLSTGIKYILDDVTSDIIAMKILNYYSKEISAREFETKLDIFRDNIVGKLRFLENFKSNDLRTP